MFPAHFVLYMLKVENNIQNYDFGESLLIPIVFRLVVTSCGFTVKIREKCLPHE